MEYNILMAKGLHYAVVDRRLLDTSKVHRRCRRADIAVPERRSGKKMEKKKSGIWRARSRLICLLEAL